MKGQAETIGLVLIVILVIILFLFALVFLTKEKTPSKANVSIKADNLMNALTKVKIEGKTIQEQASICCNTQCSNFSTSVESILKKSVEEKYALTIMKGKNVCAQIGSCSIGIASSKYRLRNEGEDFELFLLLC